MLAGRANSTLPSSCPVWNKSQVIAAAGSPSMLWLYFVLGFLLYKLAQRLLRLPRHRAPTSRVNYILITGCDSGFGSLLAKRLDAKGFYVFAACLKEKARDELQKSASSKLRAFVMDVSKTSSVKQGLETVRSYLPEEAGLWAVVNNAGVTGSKLGPAEWMTRDDFLDVMNVNFFGLVNVTNAFLPLVKKVQGRLVMGSCITGKFALPGCAPYTTSKHAVEAYSDSVRCELKPFGVSVHIVEPGFHATRLTDPSSLVHYMQKTWDNLPLATKEEYGESYFQESISLIEDTIPRLVSRKLHRVVSAYEHAVLGKYPRARYAVGLDAHLFFRPMAWLPEGLRDILLYASRQVPIPARCQQKL